MLFKQNEKGMALALVLLFTAILMSLGAALATFALSEKLIASYHARNIRLYYLAEAGVEAGIAILQEDFYYDGNLSGSLGGGTYRTTFKTVDSFSRDVIAVGTLDNYSRTITVSVELLGEPGEEHLHLRHWFNPYTND